MYHLTLVWIAITLIAYVTGRIHGASSERSRQIVDRPSPLPLKPSNKATDDDTLP